VNTITANFNTIMGNILFAFALSMIVSGLGLPSLAVCKDINNYISASGDFALHF